MAPRKRSHAAGRGSVTPSAEVRAKRQRDTAYSSPSASSSRSRLFIATRTVPSGRCLHIDYLDRENFRIGSWIRQQGWEKLCSLEVNIYPNLIREFFENISFEHESKVESVVKGVPICLDERKIGQLLEVPRAGVTNLIAYDKIEALKCILEREDVDEGRQLVSQLLSAEMRLLQSIVSTIIFPKVGRHDWVGKRELAVMYHLVTGTPMNFPSLMLQQLQDTAKKSNACLPYGMIFTLIFKDFSVNLEGEDYKKLTNSEHIREGTLNRMKFVKRGDRWVRADEQAPPGNEPEEHRSPPPPPSPTAGPSFSTPVSPHSPPVPPCPTQAPPPLFDQDQFIERVVEEVVQKVTERFMTILSSVRHQILVSIEEQRIATEGQTDMLSQQISGLSQRLEILEKEQHTSSAQVELLLTEYARTAQRLEENINLQCTTAEVLISSLRQIKDRLDNLGPRTASSSRPSPSPRPAPHLSSTRPRAPHEPIIEFLSDED